MIIAEILAGRIADVSYDGLPEAARHWAKVAIIDTVGCTLAGASEPCAQIAGRVAAIGGATGPCVVFGTAHRVGPMDAASINGTAAHALDYDDCSDTLGGHPSAPILPALFALAETRPTNGRDFIAAYVAGWETETRILGRGPTTPLPPELLRRKFADCTKRALSPDAANRLFGMLDGLETVNRISTLTEATIPGTRLAAE